MAALVDIAREFNSIDEYLKAVRDILRDGHMPDMVGLDARVSALCALLETTKPEIQQQSLKKLNELLQKLDVCEDEIRAYHSKDTTGHSQ